MDGKKPPYTILVLAPFAPLAAEGRGTPQVIPVDLFSIDHALETLCPQLRLPVATDMVPDGYIQITLAARRDFKPARILKSHPDLFVPDNGGWPKTTLPAVSRNSQVDDILAMVDRSASTQQSSPATHHSSDALLRTIFADPEFKKTESAWKGLEVLLKQADVRENGAVAVSIYSVSEDTLARALDHVASLPEEESPNLVLVDLPFANTQPSRDLLEAVVDFADRMMVPVCAWSSVDFLGIPDFSNLGRLPYLKTHLESDPYIKWNKLRKHPGAAWLLMTLNPFASRAAHDFETAPLYSSPVWALGTLCAKSVNNTGWPTHFTQYTHLQLENLALGITHDQAALAVEGLLDEERILQFTECGFTPLAGVKNKDVAFMPRETAFSGESIRFGIFFSQVIHTLILTKARHESDRQPEETLKAALQKLFDETGVPVPADISVTAESNAQEKPDRFRIALTPPASLFKTEGTIEFTFSW